MQSRHLLSGRLLTGNVIWNLAGAGLPLLVALMAIPVIIAGMGTERFGLLSIVWMGVGYFSLFDLGIGRALTKLISERLSAENTAELPALITTGMRLLWLLGVIAAISVSALSWWVSNSLLNIPAHLITEAMWSFWVMALTLPFVVSSAGLVGILQAHQRFRDINIVRMLLGILTFIAPVLALLYSTSLVATTVLLSISRLFAWLVYEYLSKPLTKTENSQNFIVKSSARELIGFGGWLTISNIIGPIMVYFDRFLIGALLTLSAVAFYTTPYEIITRVWIVPEAVVGVLFPALTAALVSDVLRARSMYVLSANALTLIVFAVAAVVILFASEALGFWLGDEFSHKSSQVLQWLSVGVFINSVARFPYILLQGKGRPDVTAKLHVIELPFYMLALWWAVGSYGIVGAACVWMVRIAIDAICLFALAGYYVGELKNEQYKVALRMVVFSLLLVMLMLPEEIVDKVILFALISMTVVATASWEYRRLQSGKYLPLSLKKKYAHE